MLHFSLIGGLIFLGYSAVNEQAAEPENVIFISGDQIERIGKNFNATWNRYPENDELKALIENAVREEVFYRDALALDLDKNDTVVRRRLRQKMEFLTGTGFDIGDPGPGELETYYDQNQNAYQRGARVAFQQVFFTSETPLKTISGQLEALQDDPSKNPHMLGDKTLLPAELDLSAANAVNGVFGRGFFERIAEHEPGVWVGPVKSAFGYHLIRISERMDAKAPPLSENRQRVLRDWVSSKAIKLREEDYQTRRARYKIVVDGREPVGGTGQ